jgi:hypothetical protein
MKRVAVRIPSELWRSIDWYGRAAGLTRPDGQLDLSETLRDLISRGLDDRRDRAAGYKSGYREGRLAGYADQMRAIAAAMPAANAGTRSPRR